MIIYEFGYSMTNKFITVSLAGSSEEIIINKLIKFLPSRFYRAYLLRYLPVNLRRSCYLGEEVQDIILPFTREEVECFGEAYMEKFLLRLKESFDLGMAFFTKHIYEYSAQEEEECKSLLKYIMLDDVIEMLLEDNGIEAKDMRLVILDSNDRRIEYVLEMLVPRLNYLTVVTERAEYFEEFVEAVFEDFGLVVETVSGVMREPLDGNVVIDMNPNVSRNYSFYREGTVILDLESSLEKRQYLYARRKRFHFFYDMKVTARGEKVDAVKFGVFLCSQNFAVRNFMVDRNKNYGVKEIQSLKNLYDMKLNRVIKLH